MIHTGEQASKPIKATRLGSGPEKRKGLSEESKKKEKASRVNIYRILQVRFFFLPGTPPAEGLLLLLRLCDC